MVVKATVALVAPDARQTGAHPGVLVALAFVVRSQRVALTRLASVARHQVPVARLALVALLTCCGTVRCDVIITYFAVGSPPFVAVAVGAKIFSAGPFEVGVRSGAWEARKLCLSF